MKIKTFTLFLLVSWNALGQSYEGFKFEFKDGTVIHGKVFSDKWYKPNPKGVSIQVRGKIYLHHYPYTSMKTYAPPPYEAYETNPIPIPRCAPTRISFMHFRNSTLKSLYKSYSQVDNKECKAISRSILTAIRKTGPTKEERPSHKKTKIWDKDVRAEYHTMLRHNYMIYGGDLNERKYINK